MSGSVVEGLLVIAAIAREVYASLVERLRVHTASQGTPVQAWTPAAGLTACGLPLHNCSTEPHGNCTDCTETRNTPYRVVCRSVLVAACGFGVVSDGFCARVSETREVTYVCGVLALIFARVLRGCVFSLHLQTRRSSSTIWWSRLSATVCGQSSGVSTNKSHTTPVACAFRSFLRGCLYCGFL